MTGPKPNGGYHLILFLKMKSSDIEIGGNCSYEIPLAKGA